MDRAAKRQRRLTVLDSDDDGLDEIDVEVEVEKVDSESDYGEDVFGRVKNNAGMKTKTKDLPLLSRSRQPNVKPKPNPNPKPPRKPPSASPSPKKNQPNKPEKSLHNFFAPASEEQRWSKPKPTPKEIKPAKEAAPTPLVEDEDDLIEDYDSYDELFAEIGGGNGGIVGSKQGKVGGEKERGKASKPDPKKTTRKFPSSKRFLLPDGGGGEGNGNGDGKRAEHDTKTKDDRPWAQRYAPMNLDEIAVHKKKVSDVQSWLSDSFTGKNPRKLLVLRGPAGSGKTTTIELLSRALGFDILEWKNPSVTDIGKSAGAQFEEFLARGDVFGGLELDSGETESSSTRVLLVEEFPTVLNSTSTALAAFRSSLLRHLAGATGDCPPVVMIVSETLLSSASSVSDNLTVHRLLGPVIYNHPSITIIDFNAIAPTFMSKALKLALEKDARQSKRTRIPGPSVLESISQIGDIRSAISSLEFLCLKGDNDAWGGATKAKKSRGVALTSMEKESMKMITQREASLGMFHAIGKIMYNKREDPSLSEGIAFPPPPDFLPQHNRPKISQVSVNELVDETGTDVQTFISALHENYPPSCDGHSFTDCLDDCIEALSGSDILCATKGLRGTATNLNMNSGIDKLRQDDMSYQVAARGLLFALPYPVKRRTAGTRGNAHKMYFPTSLRLWHESEKIEGLLDLWDRRLLDPFSSDVSGLDRKPKGDGVEEAATVTRLSRTDMLLYQLPYLARISENEVDRKELGLITDFHGGVQSHRDDDGNFEDDDIPISMNPTRLPPRIDQSRGKSKGSSSAFGPRLPPPVMEEEKLILSDDDIED